MSIHRILMSVVGISSLALVVGCGDARDVEVTGDVTAAEGVPADAPVRIEFHERAESEMAGEEGELALVHSISVDEPGAFSATVPLEGTDLFTVAFVDRDENGACTDGEPWGSAETVVEEGQDAHVEIRIEQKTSCPTLAE